MAEPHTHNTEDTPLDTCLIPENFADTGRCFSGAIRTRNLIEGVIFAAPIAYVTTHMGLPMQQSITVTVMTAGIVLALCVVGVNGDSVTEFLINFAIFIKNKRRAKYNPRIKMEAKPGYLTKDAYELPRDKIIRIYNELMQGYDSEDVSSDIYSPIYKEFFRDDLGQIDTPYDLMTRKERRAIDKQKKKAAREAKKAAKLAEKRNKKGRKDEKK